MTITYCFDFNLFPRITQQHKISSLRSILSPRPQQYDMIACFSSRVFRKGGNIHNNHWAQPRTSCSTKTSKLLSRLFPQRKTHYSPASAEAAVMSLDPEAQCMAEANRAAHWDLSNKANANRYALILIYVYTVIYVCVNGGGYQLQLDSHDVDCIIDKI